MQWYNLFFFTGSSSSTIRIVVDDDEPVKKIGLYHGISGSGEKAKQLYYKKNSTTLDFTHQINSGEDEHYYYAIIDQVDGDRIWCSAIWYTKE